LRYKINDEQQNLKLIQLTYRMHSLGILEGVHKGSAFKILAEICLTTDLIDMKMLEEYKRRKDEVGT